MDTPDAREPRHFWASAYALKLIRQAIGNPAWGPRPGQEVWETLRDEIVNLNSRGRVKTPDAPMFTVEGVENYCFIEDQLIPEKDDGEANCLEFRIRLFVLARLLRAFREHLQGRIGKVKGLSVPKLVTRLADPEHRFFFTVAWTAGAMKPPAAVSYLRGFSRKRGGVYQLPGGQEQGYRDRDCGIGPIVEATRQAARVVAALRKTAGKTAQTPASKRKIRVKELDGPSFRLKPRGKERKSFVLKDKLALLFEVLFRAYQKKELKHNGWVPYLSLLGHVWPKPSVDKGDPGEDDEKAAARLKDSRPKSVLNFKVGVAPVVLKKLRSDLESEIREGVGFPETGRQFWVETQEGYGYRLNQSGIVWWEKPEPQNRNDPEPRPRKR